MSVLAKIRSPKDVRALAEEALPKLCAELREEIISICGRVGGHLGASLGAIELVVALHRVFKSPVDRLVFDVGHQAYAHKLLTGRRARMGTLRQEGGIAPFLDPVESPHDAFAAGHACTAVSAALGILLGKRHQGQPGKAVAIVGDGSFTGGLTFEGLNNAAVANEPLVVVLNDNRMSISTNVGAVSALLQGRPARAFFEALGFIYIGPLDGHRLELLLPAMREARNAQRPVVVHVRTIKGKGFAPAEGDRRTRGHAMGPYELRAGKLVRTRGGAKTFSEAFAAALEARMATDDRVVVVTPAMLEGSALVRLRDLFPGRVYDVGIAEQHAVTFCAGLAISGLRPVCAIYSTFLQRAVDQVIHDVCLPRLPVIFAIDRAGLVGADGATHQGAYDIALLRPLPHTQLFAPVLEEDVGAMLDEALAAPGPSGIRLPRMTLPDRPRGLKIGRSTKARWLKKAKRARLTIVAAGPLVLEALAAAKDEDDWSVLDARRLWPLDEEALALAASSGHLVTVEEGTRRGGLGGAVLELCADRGWSPRVRCLGLPDTPVPHGDARAQRRALGLSEEGIRAAARSCIDGG